MQDFEWKPEYMLNEPVVDKEHKYLFSIANKASHVVDPSLRSKKIKDVVHELFEYTRIHFKHEEIFMQKYSFPKLNEHIKQHEKIINLLNDFVQRLPSMSVSAIERELAHFVDIGLVNHIIHHDMLIKVWLQNRQTLIDAIKWRDAYSSGHSELDMQLQELFRLALASFELPQDLSQKQEQHIAAFHLFLLGAKKYMSNIEKQMQAIEYPDEDISKRMHSQIIEQIEIFNGKADKLKEGDFEVQLAKLDHQWLVIKLVNENRKLAMWITKQQEKNDNTVPQDNPENVHDLF